MGTLTAKDIDKLLRNIEVTDSGCWEYIPLRDGGYGCIALEHYPKTRTRILLYSILVKEIKDAQAVNTTCHNKFCVNPEHVLVISSDEDRFWDRVVKKSDDGCWEWQGALNRGYGVIRINFKSVGVHRYSWELHNGPIPDELLVCHKCDNRRCVNPEHLFLGSYDDNNKDRDRKNRGRHPSKENHGRAILTERDVREIRSLYKNKQKTQYELGDMFGVKRSTIANIVRNVTWKGV